jgi:hypothetical protein
MQDASVVVAEETEAKRLNIMSYKEYQRQQESKIWSQMQQSESVHFSLQSSPRTPDPPQKQPDEQPQTSGADQDFFDSLDAIVRGFVQAVTKLKRNREFELKMEYVACSTEMTARVNELMDAARGYHLLQNIPEDFKVDDRGPLFVKALALKCAELTKVAQAALTKAKIASGVWPPPEAPEEMMRALAPVATGVKGFVDFVKTAVRALRILDAPRKGPVAEEKLKTKLLESARVRETYQQWEQLQKTVWVSFLKCRRLIHHH